MRKKSTNEAISALTESSVSNQNSVHVESAPAVSTAVIGGNEPTKTKKKPPKRRAKRSRITMPTSWKPPKGLMTSLHPGNFLNYCG